MINFILFSCQIFTQILGSFYGTRLCMAVGPEQMRAPGRSVSDGLPNLCAALGIQIYTFINKKFYQGRKIGQFTSSAS